MSAREVISDVLTSSVINTEADADTVAETILAALREAGLVVVPAEPLEVVLNAAKSHWDEGPADEGWQSAKLGAACHAIERAMLAAAKEDKR